MPLIRMVNDGTEFKEVYSSSGYEGLVSLGFSQGFGEPISLVGGSLRRCRIRITGGAFKILMPGLTPNNLMKWVWDVTRASEFLTDPHNIQKR